MIEPSKWMCAQYDLTGNRWEKPIELFREEDSGHAGPFLAIDSNNVLHSVWSYAKFHRKGPMTIREGSGIFYRSGYETLTKTQTVTSAISAEPKVIVDKNGEVHVFWTQNSFEGTQDSGLFHWQPDGSKVDLLIPEQQVGLLDVAVSDNNDMHVVFVKFTEKPQNAVLEYVKIVK